MSIYDQYGQGRESVILEMIEYCNNEIARIKLKGQKPNDPHSIHLAGQINALYRVRDRLTGKLTSMEQRAIKINFRK